MSVILATAGYDHKIRFWEAPSALSTKTLPFPDSQVNCLDITPDKQFLAAAGNPHIRIYEINSSSNSSSSGSAPLLVCEGHQSSVTSIGFQNNGRWMYSGSEDGTVKVFDLRSSTFQRSFNAKFPVKSVALHPNQTNLISGDSSGSIKVWDLRQSKNCINELVPDASKMINECNTTTSATKQTQHSNTKPGHSTSTGTSDGKDNTGESSSTIKNPLRQSHSTSAALHSRASMQSVDIDARILVAANNHAQVFVWNHDTESGNSTSSLQPITTYTAHPPGSYLLKAKISPDSHHIVTTGSDWTARLWDTKVFSMTATLGMHHGWVWDAVFSADSSYLVTASSDASARLWNLRTNEVIRQYSGHHGAVTCVALNDSST
jgi:G protein beta subunit-like protein